MMAPKSDAFIGVADHAGWAVFVTATKSGELLDRRRVALLDAGLPILPYHHDAQGLPLDEATALIERVRASAERHAKGALDAVASDVPARILGVVIRECPVLPPTIAERLQNYRAQNVADTVMFRRALAGAADARGWAVYWYDTRSVLGAARNALGIEDIEAHFTNVKRSIGAPWTKDHKLAMAAAIAGAHGANPAPRRDI